MSEQSSKSQPKQVEAPWLWRLAKKLLMPYLSQPATKWINFAMVLVLSASCIAYGGFILFSKQPQIVYSSLYSQECKGVGSCQLSFSLKSPVRDPVAVYYVLKGFVQNTKDYSRSRVMKQLLGDTITKEQATRCHPQATNAQMNVSNSWNGSVLNPLDIASPCGLQAKNMFTDTFVVKNSTFSSLPIRRTGLINRFKQQPQSAATQWINPTNEAFQLWMHDSIGKDLKKLYGIIDAGLEAGSYTITIGNGYSYQQNEQKQVVLAAYTPQLENCRELAIFLIISGGSLLLIYCARACLNRLKLGSRAAN